MVSLILVICNDYLWTQYIEPYSFNSKFEFLKFLNYLKSEVIQFPRSYEHVVYILIIISSTINETLKRRIQFDVKKATYGFQHSEGAIW